MASTSRLRPAARAASRTAPWRRSGCHAMDDAWLVFAMTLHDEMREGGTLTDSGRRGVKLSIRCRETIFQSKTPANFFAKVHSLDTNIHVVI